LLRGIARIDELRTVAIRIVDEASTCCGREQAGWLMVLSSDSDDVIVTIKRGNSSTVFVLGTSVTPDQFIVRTHDEAVSRAISYAKRQGVRAWFAGDDGFVLLGTFRPVTLEHAK
jgi:hypothetical protein